MGVLAGTAVLPRHTSSGRQQAFSTAQQYRILTICRAVALGALRTHLCLCCQLCNACRRAVLSSSNHPYHQQPICTEGT